jgi:hypothetical protein
MQGDIGQNSHLQPGLVGLEPLATLPSHYWEVVSNCSDSGLIRRLKTFHIHSKPAIPLTPSISQFRGKNLLK